MNLKVKREVLNGLVSKAQKVAKVNPHIALTTFVQLESDGEILSISGYDGMNYYLFKVKNKGEKAKFVFNADAFFRLFSKTTSEFIELKDEESFISFKGNGLYKLNKEIDKSTEEQITINFPDVTLKKGQKIKTDIFSKTVARVLPGISEDQSPVYLTGVLGRADRFLATDPNRSVMVQIKLIKGEVLFSAEFLKMVSLFDSASFEFEVVDKDGISYCVASSSDGYIIGSQVLGKSDFPASELDNIFNLPQESSLVVKKDDLLSVIDRFSVFADRIGEQGVIVMVSKDGLILKKDNIGEEIIKVSNVIKFKPYQCSTDILRLKKLIESADTEKLTFVFGNDNFLIFKYDNTQLLLSTIEE